MPHPLTPEKQSTSQKFSDRIWWAVTPIDGLLSTPRLTNDNQYPTATWDPPSHSQLVPHLPLPSCSCRFQPASRPALTDPEWGVSCMACSVSRARKIRQAANSPGTFTEFESYYSIKPWTTTNLQTYAFAVLLVLGFTFSRDQETHELQN